MLRINIETTRRCALPFVYIYEDIEFDDDIEMMETKAEYFNYENPQLGDKSGSASVLDDQKSGILDRLTGNAVPSYLKLTDDDKVTIKTFMPALKNAGIRRCELSYDGGSDEGFGTLEHCEDASGNKFGKEQLLANSAFVAELAPFVTGQFSSGKHPVYLGDQTPDAVSMIGDYLEFDLPVILVSLLVGRGYGTGEYELYGRATVDLDTMTITDDPNAPYPHGTSD